MKKSFLLLSMLVFAIVVNAQYRKSWDFTK